MEPRFLDLAEVIEIHLDQIERYAGATGTRDLALLQSAVAMPQAGVAQEYVHGDLFEMAAAYLFHITRNHPFVDGNKRAGAAAALTFLDLNGITVEPPTVELVDMVERAARGDIEKSGIAEFLRDHVSGLPEERRRRVHPGAQGRRQERIRPRDYRGGVHRRAAKVDESPWCMKICPLRVAPSIRAHPRPDAGCMSSKPDHENSTCGTPSRSTNR